MKSLVDLIEEWSPNTDEMNLKCLNGEEFWIFMKKNYMMTYKTMPNSDRIEIYAFHSNGDIIKCMNRLFPPNKEEEFEQTL